MWHPAKKPEAVYSISRLFTTSTRWAVEQSIVAHPRSKTEGFYGGMNWSLSTQWGLVTQIFIILLIQVMSPVCLVPSHYLKQMLTYCQLDPWEQTAMNFQWNYNKFCSWKCFWKCCLQNVSHFAKASIINSSDARGRIFWLIWPIPCLLMPWLLKLPGHQ